MHISQTISRQTQYGSWKRHSVIYCGTVIIYSSLFIFLTRFKCLTHFLLLILNFFNWLQTLSWEVEENDKVPLWGGFVMRCCFTLSIICGRSVGVAITAETVEQTLVGYICYTDDTWPMCAVNLTVFWRNVSLCVFRVSVPQFHKMCGIKSNQNVLGISP